MAAFLGIVFDGIAYGSLLFLISLGLSVTMGVMNFVNLAHGTFAMLGGFLCVELTRRAGMPFLLTLPVVFVAVGLAGAALELVFYRRLYRRAHLDQVLFTIGISFMAGAAATWAWGPSQQPVQVPAFLRRQLHVLGIDVGAYRLFLVMFVLAVTAGLGQLLSRTRFGAQLRAAVDNPRAAAGAGVNVGLLFTVTFALGSGLAGLGGALAIDVLGLDPTFGLKYLVYFLIVVVVGGAGSFKGSLVAALLLGVLDVAGKYYVPQVGSFIIYAAMVALLILFQQGCMAGARNWRPLEVVFWAVPIPAFFVMDDRRQFLSQIFIYGLLAVSLDLILGYAGILSLGHAAFFGVGAYTAGLLARHGWSEPFSGLAAAGLLAGGFGYATSFLVVSGADLARLMVTLGVGLVAYEAANQASSITGGVDGLSDMQPAALFGKFSFGLDGTTAFIYSLAVLALMFAFARRLVHSPFGLTLRGIRENPRRMPAIGVDVHRRLRTVFGLSAAMAGVAGALLAQTTRFVGIDTLGFQRSAELLIILAFGGTGRLYGALVGAAVFMLGQDGLAGLSPEYWQFWLGAVLVLLVLAAPGGLMGALDLLRGQLVQRRTRGLGLRAWRWLAR